MPSDLENALALMALRERQEFLERRQRELERLLYDFLAIASGKPGAVLAQKRLAEVSSVSEVSIRKASRALSAGEPIAGADADEVARR